MSWEQGLTGKENCPGARDQRAAAAGPARGPRLHTCDKPWKGCPEEGGSRLGEKLAGFSEAMAMYDGSTSDESGSTRAPAGENGLDRAASKGLAKSVAATTARLQLYQNHASAELMLPAPDATKGGVDEEEGRASWWLFQFLAILLELVLGLFVFGRTIPRCSSAAGAAWRSYVVSYLLISPEIALVAAAATSVRGSDYTITKSSKIKTNELSGYVDNNSDIGTARDPGAGAAAAVLRRATGIDPAAPVWGAPFRELAALYDGADPPLEALGVSAKFSERESRHRAVLVWSPGLRRQPAARRPAPRGRAHGRCAQGAAARRRLARRACHGGAAASLRFRRRRGRGRREALRPEPRRCGPAPATSGRRGGDAASI